MKKTVWCKPYGSDFRKSLLSKIRETPGEGFPLFDHEMVENSPFEVYKVNFDVALQLLPALFEGKKDVSLSAESDKGSAF